MPLDAEKIRFKGKAIKAALDLNASISGDETAPFLDQLYQEFKSQPTSSSPESWLSERLSNAFLSLDAPPVWVESEPAWPFFEGSPMVFIGQTTIPQNSVSDRHLSSGETVYLFGSRRNLKNGFEMVYRVVSQFTELG